MRHFGRIVVGLVLVVSTWPCTLLNAQERTQGRTRTPRAVRGAEVETKGSTKWALLFGANNYQNDQLARLAYCNDDMSDLKDTLVRRAGFPEEQVICRSLHIP